MNLVSEVQVIPLRSYDGELVAFANFTLAGAVRCKSVAILRRLYGGYRLTYPMKKFGSKHENYYFPINNAAGREIEDAVIAEYQRIVGAYHNG